jgi:hypothetical protein
MAGNIWTTKRVFFSCAAILKAEVYKEAKLVIRQIQIAHAINQFSEKQKGTKALLKERSKKTLRNLWYKLMLSKLYFVIPRLSIASLATGVVLLE